MEDGGARGKAFLEYSLDSDEGLFSPEDRHDAQERGNRILSDQMEQLKLAVHKIVSSQAILSSSPLEQAERSAGPRLIQGRRALTRSLEEPLLRHRDAAAGLGYAHGHRLGQRAGEKRRMRARGMTGGVKATSGFVSSTDMGSSLRNKSTAVSLFAGKELVNDL